MAGGVHGQIQIVHRSFWVGLLEAGDDVGSQFAGHRVGASNCGIDVEDLHVSLFVDVSVWGEISVCHTTIGLAEQRVVL